MIPANAISIELPSKILETVFLCFLNTAVRAKPKTIKLARQKRIIKNRENKRIEIMIVSKIPRSARHPVKINMTRSGKTKGMMVKATTKIFAEKTCPCPKGRGKNTCRSFPSKKIL